MFLKTIRFSRGCGGSTFGSVASLVCQLQQLRRFSELDVLLEKSSTIATGARAAAREALDEFDRESAVRRYRDRIAVPGIVTWCPCAVRARVLCPDRLPFLQIDPRRLRRPARCNS